MKILSKCEFNVSNTCKKEFYSTSRNINRTKLHNNGKIICLHCSRKLKYSGRNNPNSTYNINDNFFEDIDSREKAWILGWIASDGSIRDTGAISIALHRKDIDVLEKIKKIICNGVPIKSKNKNIISISFNSTKMANDICKHLDINPGKKDSIVGFPHHIKDELKWDFIRGLFEGDGNVANPNLKNTPECNIASYSQKMKDGIELFTKIPCNKHHSETRKNIEWYGVNSLDFLGKMYSNSILDMRMDRKYNIYEQWISWVPKIGGVGNSGRFGELFWAKTKEEAFPLKKERISDSGYDLTVIGIAKQLGEVTLFSTGIKISAPHGVYFDLVPRSSIIKSGYILANSVGVIDRSYRGEILVPLIKIDKNAPNLPLPSRIVQLIPRLIPHIELVEVSELTDTPRGVGGFGSSGQ